EASALRPGHAPRRAGQGATAWLASGAPEPLFSPLPLLRGPSCLSWVPAMHKDQVSQVLADIGTLLELQGENSFRCNAYHNAARAIQQLETNLADLVTAGKLDEIPGIGATLKDKITTLVTTGHLPFYDDLRKKTPAGLFELLRL